LSCHYDQYLITLIKDAFQFVQAIVRQLLAAGANPTIKDGNKKTIIDRAKNKSIRADLIRAAVAFE
jgi:ankyrin repeat protein